MKLGVNLVIDIGNSNSKAAIFQDREIVFYDVVQDIDASFLSELISRFKVEHAIASTVRKDVDSLVEVLKAGSHYIEFSTEKNPGIHNQYLSKATLGLDRWANVIAAHQLYPGQDCLVIDAGTCITYDLLHGDSNYYGGSISPGIQMRFKALNHYTGRLPLINWNDQETIPDGQDTKTAMLSGVLQGVIYEIEGFIASQHKIKQELKVLITGGDAPFLWKQLKNSIFAPQIINDPYLVLKGLNEVIAFEYV